MTTRADGEAPAEGLPAGAALDGAGGVEAGGSAGHGGIAMQSAGFRNRDTPNERTRGV